MSNQLIGSLADACTHAEKNGRPRMLSRALICAADVRLALGHYGAAKNLLRRAGDLLEQAGDVLLHTLALTRLGTAEQGEGNLSAAVALHHRALSQQRTLSPLTDPHCVRLEMHIRCRLGRTYSAAGGVDEAQEQFRTALALPGAGAYPEEHALGLRDSTSAKGRLRGPGQPCPGES
ncbi:hypothetical protein [Streptomyces sp. NPDC054786]